MPSLILKMIFTSNITHNHYTALRMSSLEVIVFAAAHRKFKFWQTTFENFTSMSIYFLWSLQVQYKLQRWQKKHILSSSTIFSWFLPFFGTVYLYDESNKYVGYHVHIVNFLLLFTNILDCEVRLIRKAAMDDKDLFVDQMRHRDPLEEFSKKFE